MIILASASPRRKELLKKIIPDFKVCESNIDETIPQNIELNSVAEHLATKKALNVYKNNPNDIVIGADTIIVFDNKIYGKPKNQAEAKEMIEKFSGNRHIVITGVCIVDKNKTLSFSSVNEVEFYSLNNNEIEDYLSTASYFDKAGAYAIQDLGGLFVKEIKGDYNSIIGLPISRLHRILKTFFNL